MSCDSEGGRSNLSHGTWPNFSLFFCKKPEVFLSHTLSYLPLHKLTFAQGVGRNKENGNLIEINKQSAFSGGFL